MSSQTVRGERRLANVPARMTVAGEERPVTIANGSAEGLMLRCDSPPDVGAWVEVRRGAARASGKVMWRHGRRFALRSEAPLDLAALFADLPTPAGELILDKTDRAKSRFAWPARRR